MSNGIGWGGDGSVGDKLPREEVDQNESGKRSVQGSQFLNFYM